MDNRDYTDIYAGTRDKYTQITRSLIRESKTITTMESCTSGLIASLVTDTEGSSAIMKGAFVTYSNEAKIMQGIPEETIRTYGVYSEETACAMARRCREIYGADYGVGVTGSFGNVDPANADSVPGEVCYALAGPEGTRTYHCTVPAQPSRYAYKMYMADRIADCILEHLQTPAP